MNDSRRAVGARHAADTVDLSHVAWSPRDPIRFHFRNETMLRSPFPRRTPREQEGMRGEHWSLALRYSTKGMSRFVRRIYS